MYFDIKSLKKKCKLFINWFSLLKMWKIKSIELYVWLIVILYSEEVLIYYEIFYFVYIFFFEVIGICNINCDIDESFEIFIEF